MSVTIPPSISHSVHLGAYPRSLDLVDQITLCGYVFRKLDAVYFRPHCRLVNWATNTVLDSPASTQGGQ